MNQAMDSLWDLAPDYASTADTLRTLATHLLARARWEATDRIGLRPTPGGIGTPTFGDQAERVRFSGGSLVHEVAGPVGAQTRVAALNGATIAELGELARVDLSAEFTVGNDTPPLPPVSTIISVNPQACAQVGAWYSLVDEALVALLGGLPNAEPSALQIWPEHFDMAVDLAAAPGIRLNVGGSPGDSFSSEPYLYVGPWNSSRPADPATGNTEFWNAPFGASFGFDQLRKHSDPIAAAVEFFRKGIDLLAAQ